MSKNIFHISCLLKQDKNSISQIANRLIDLLSKLSKVDPIFDSFVYSKENFTDVNISISKMGVNESKVLLANTILASNLEYVKKNNQTNVLDLDYSCDFGFFHLLKFYKNQENYFSITGNIGSSQYPSLNLAYFYGSEIYPYEWYYDVLSCLVMELNPEYASVNISLTTFIEESSKLKVKSPLGWITYFSNDNLVTIPDDLDIEYEFTEKGKFLILTKNDFTDNKEMYLTHKNKLLNLMSEIKKRSPKYSLS